MRRERPLPKVWLHSRENGFFTMAAPIHSSALRFRTSGELELNQRVIMYLSQLLVATAFTAGLVAAPYLIAQQATAPQGPSAQAASIDMAAVKKLIDRGQSKEALRQLDVAEAQQPAMPGIERLRGMAFYAEGEFTEADQALAKALEQNSKDIEAAEYRGLTLFRMGRTAEAIPIP